MLQNNKMYFELFCWLIIYNDKMIVKLLGTQTKSNLRNEETIYKEFLCLSLFFQKWSNKYTFVV